MNENLLKYRITPRVVCAGCETVITVEGLDESCRFYDDLSYRISILKRDGFSYFEGKEATWAGRDFITELTVSPVNGVLSFSHCFDGEQEWAIQITRLESDLHVPERYRLYWKKNIDALYKPFEFLIYSLEADLYGTRPLKGDLHIHSYESDGSESPELVAAQYRKLGFDYIALTDHFFLAPSLQAIQSFSQIPTALKIFSGEEVHPYELMNGNTDTGIFHVINFNPKTSVNRRALEEPEAVRAEIDAIYDELTDISDRGERWEAAWYTWIYRAIHAAGGIVIYPHPYWVLRGTMSVRSSATDMILERHLCDVCEILGGTDLPHNCMQVQMYQEKRAQGFHYPWVASSDSHSVLKHGRFNQAWTVTFARNAEEIPDRILAGMSVAVDNAEPNSKNVYGELRLARYAWFLLDNYFEQHDELCDSAGQAIRRLVLGDSAQKPLIEALEREIARFGDEFFGAQK